MKYVITLGQKKDRSLVVLYLGNDVHAGKKACLDAQDVAIAETIKDGKRIKHRKFGHLDPLPVPVPAQRTQVPEDPQAEETEEDSEESDSDAGDATESDQSQPKTAKKPGKPKSKPVPAASGEEDPLA